MWLPVSVNRPENITLAVGRWLVGIDNTRLGVRPGLLRSVTPSLPVGKTWRGKTWSLDSAEVSPDGRRVWFGLTVTSNPLPLAVVVASLGIAGGLVAAVFLVRELRRWLPIGEVTRSALPYVAAGVIVLFLVVAMARLTRGAR